MLFSLSASALFGIFLQAEKHKRPNIATIHIESLLTNFLFTYFCNMT